MTSTLYLLNRGLKKRQGRRQQGRQKGNRFRLAKQQLCTCITLFCTFPYRHCTTTTWECQISRLLEDMNTRQRLCFSFPEFRYRLNFQISTSEKIANIFAVERDGKSIIVLIVVLGLASEEFFWPLFPLVNLKLFYYLCSWCRLCARAHFFT